MLIYSNFYTIFVQSSLLVVDFQAVWSLKMRCLTRQLLVDDLEAEEEGMADTVLDTNTIATAARPGTSLRAAAVTAPALTSR